jgi:glycosyltransferase family protein
MNRVIKRKLVNVVYWVNNKYCGIDNLRVHTVDETLNDLLKSDKSLVRFGDGEIELIRGNGIKTQRYDRELSKRLKQIIHHSNENIMVTIPDIFGNLGYMNIHSINFWKEHLCSCRKIYKKYCDKNYFYYTTSVTRNYMAYIDQSRCAYQYECWKKLWNGKNITIVEGAVSHNGVGNDLFSNVNSIRRIICPSMNAYSSYEEIFGKCIEERKDNLILLSIGAASKPLVEDLTNIGYRVIDIGNLDMEYDWFIAGAKDKTYIIKRHIVGRDENMRAGYQNYLDEIITEIK